MNISITKILYFVGYVRSCLYKQAHLTEEKSFGQASLLFSSLLVTIFEGPFIIWSLFCLISMTGFEVLSDKKSLVITHSLIWIGSIIYFRYFPPKRFGVEILESEGRKEKIIGLGYGLSVLIVGVTLLILIMK